MLHFTVISPTDYTSSESALDCTVAPVAVKVSGYPILGSFLPYQPRSSRPQHLPSWEASSSAAAQALVYQILDHGLPGLAI